MVRAPSVRFEVVPGGGRTSQERRASPSPSTPQRPVAASGELDREPRTDSKLWIKAKPTAAAKRPTIPPANPAEPCRVPRALRLAAPCCPRGPRDQARGREQERDRIEPELARAGRSPDRGRDQGRECHQQAKRHQGERGEDQPAGQRQGRHPVAQRPGPGVQIDRARPRARLRNELGRAGRSSRTSIRFVPPLLSMTTAPRDVADRRSRRIVGKLDLDRQLGLVDRHERMRPQTQPRRGFAPSPGGSTRTELRSRR